MKSFKAVEKVRRYTNLEDLKQRMKRLEDALAV